MCGSCGMVINGRERLACKTNVTDLSTGDDITLRPMNHFPVIKDLVVDMDPLFRKFRDTLSFFEPKEELTEPAQIPPDAPEREEIRIATDCIACGCCVSSCTMVHHHPEYVGPAALARAYSLIADSRDGLFAERLAAAVPSCHECRSEMNCTEVCPKGISPTRAIKYIQRVALTHANKPLDPIPTPEDFTPQLKIDRATFLRQAGVFAVGAAVALTIGGVAITAAVGPGAKATTENWVPLAKFSDLPAAQVTTVLMKYQTQSGIYAQEASRPVMISRLGPEIICYKTACPHLGCTVRWDGQSDEFRCACHGGTFDRNGHVIAGPPPHGLDQYQSKVEGDQLFVLV
jgi:succinate dehydrogenase / fumarate reductase iron-sulfur subunit